MDIAITRINRSKIAIFLIIAKCLGKILEQEKWLVELFGFAVGGIQTLISIFAFWYLIFVGIWNIVFGIKRVNKKEKLLYMSIDEIYNDYSSRLSSIIVFLVLKCTFWWNHRYCRSNLRFGC